MNEEDRDRGIAIGLLVTSILALIVIAVSLESGDLVLEPAGTLPHQSPEPYPNEGAGPIDCPGVLIDWRPFTIAIGTLGAVAGYGALRGGVARTVAALATPACVGWGLLCEPYPPLTLPTGIGPPLPIETVPVVKVLYGLLIVNLLTLAILALIWFSQRPAPTPSGPESSSADATEQADLASIGMAAGNLADQIEAGDAGDTNIVYEAWLDMIRRVPVVDPETSSPGDFEEAAIRIGLSPDHVRELTELFEDVRYGDRDPSERAERAVTTLRQIEAEYSQEDS